MKLLEQLYQISAPSGKETAMRKFIMEYCKNIEGTKVSKDRKGNIYVTKGEDKNYPCIVAHMDEVHATNKNKEIVIHGNIIFGIDTKEMKLTGIGADDKNGIWVALNLLYTENVLKCAFFVGEETGCNGSKNANMAFFNNVRYVLQCDRRNSKDFITSANGVELSNKDFYEVCEAKKFGYKITDGLLSDVVALKQNGLNVCAVNLSCGYYNPHHNDEMTRFDELQNCLNLCGHIIKVVKTVQKHKYTEKQAFIGACKASNHDREFDWRGWVNSYDNEYQLQAKAAKLVAQTDIENDYQVLSEIYDSDDVRTYLKKKYQFLNDARYIEQCIDNFLMDNEFPNV